MVYGRFCREVGSPARRLGLLQGGWPVSSHNPRGHILRPRLHPSRLNVLGPGRREPDECCGWLLWSEKADLGHFSISARYVLRTSLVSKLARALSCACSISACQLISTWCGVAWL